RHGRCDSEMTQNCFNPAATFDRRRKSRRLQRDCLPGRIILCKLEDWVVAESAQRDLPKPVGVSGFVTRLVESLTAAFRGSLPSPREPAAGRVERRLLCAAVTLGNRCQEPSPLSGSWIARDHLVLWHETGRRRFSA